jgi:hypothetical protein
VLKTPTVTGIRPRQPDGFLLPLCRERSGYNTRKGKKLASVTAGFQLPAPAANAGIHEGANPMATESKVPASKPAKHIRRPTDDDIPLMALALRLGKVSHMQDKAWSEGDGVEDACTAELTALEDLILARPATTLDEAAVQLALVHEEIACQLEPGEQFDAKESARKIGRAITSVFAVIRRETLIDLRAIIGGWAGPPDSPFSSCGSAPQRRAAS